MDLAIHGISGALSGLVAVFIWYPLDNLRMKIQVNDLNNSKKESSEFNLSSKYFTDQIDTINFIVRLIKEHKVQSLYRGMSSAAFGSIASYGIYFLVYNYFKILLLKSRYTSGLAVNSLIASFLSAFIVSIMMNPIWVLNTRMMKSRSISNLEMVVKILKDEGISGFFKGIVPSLVMTANPVIQFLIYELLRSKLIDDEGQIGGMNIVFISLISKFLTTLITYPMLAMRTILQVNEDKNSTEIIQLFLRIFKSQGVFGFYKGISAKLVQTLTNNAVLMLTYENLLSLLHKMCSVILNLDEQ